MSCIETELGDDDTRRETLYPSTRVGRRDCTQLTWFWDTYFLNNGIFFSVRAKRLVRLRGL